FAADNTLDDIVAGEKNEVGSGLIRQRHHTFDLLLVDIGSAGVEIADHRDAQRLSEDRVSVGARDVVLDNAKAAGLKPKAVSGDSAEHGHDDEEALHET